MAKGHLSVCEKRKHVSGSLKLLSSRPTYTQVAGSEWTKFVYSTTERNAEHLSIVLFRAEWWYLGSTGSAPETGSDV